MSPLVPDHLLALFLAVIFPYFAARSYRRMVRRIRAGEPGVRLDEYRSTIAIQWSLVGILALVWWQAGRPWALLGLGQPPGWRLGLGLGVTLLGLAFLGWQWVAVRRLEGAGLDGVRAQLEPVRDMLPHTEAEHQAFRALAFTAGVCEEALYRGFLLWYAAWYLGVWPAVLVTGAVFGVAHFYQGRAGILKTAVIGTAAGALYVGAGSLLWPMILHVAVDLQGGAVARRVLAAEAPRADSGAA